MDNNQNDFNQTNLEQENLEQENLEQGNANQNNFEQQPPEPVVTLEPEIKRPVLAVKDSLFLVMCILISVATFASFGVIELLLTIGMWIAFANAKSDKSLLSPAKLCAGTMKANYIIIWVLSVICLVCSAILIGFSLVMPAIFNSNSMEILYEYEELTLFFDSLAVAGIANEVAIVLIYIVLGIALVIIGVVLILLNLFFTKNVCKFAYSIRNNIESGAPIVKAKTVSTWILVMAILSGISVFGSITDLSTFISTGVTVALYIVTYIWFKKYFVEQ